MLAWQTPGAGRFSPGSWRIARGAERRGAAGTEQELRAAGRRQSGTSGEPLDSMLCFLSLWAPGRRRGGGSGQQAAGQDVARACPLFEPALEASEGSASSRALPYPPGSRLLVPRAG